MNQLIVTKTPKGRWDVEVDGEWRGEIRHEPDGLGYESRRSSGAMWEWISSFTGALADVVGLYDGWPE